MNAEIVELDTSVHHRVQKLLPWAVLGKLPEAERELVEGHLSGCAQCRDDLAWQRRLQAVQPAASAAPSMERALAGLLPRLGAAPRAPRWMRWALAAQLLVIAGLGAQLLRPHDAYRLLGGAAPAGADLVVVFRPETSVRQLHAILDASAARVVGGPTVADAWLLQVPAPGLDAAVLRLRAEPAVALAEPLHSGGAR